jgi:hypothetical protein
MKDVFNQLRLLFLTLLAGQLFFAGVIYFLIAQNPDSAGQFDLIEARSLGALAPLILFAAAGGAFLLTQRKKASGAELPDVDSKLADYRTMNIFRWALMEGASMAMVIFAMLMNNSFYLLYFLVAIGVFALFRPSPEAFIEGYRLSERERTALRRALE